MQEFGEELRELKHASSFGEKEPKPSGRGGHRAKADETNNLSRSELGQKEEEARRAVGWDDFPAVDHQLKTGVQSASANPITLNTDSHLADQRPPDSQRRQYLPTNLKSGAKIRSSIPARSAQETQFDGQRSNQQDSIEPQNSAVFQAFFSNVERMKQTQSKFPGNSGSNPAPGDRAKSSLSQKDPIVVPKDPYSAVKLNKKVERKIISSLIGEVDPAPVQKAEAPSAPLRPLAETLATKARAEPVPGPQPSPQSVRLPTRESPRALPLPPTDGDFSLQNYVDLGQFPIYHNPKSLLYLKASSLFNDTILFENESLSLFCRTDRRLLVSSRQVVLVLTFKPKKTGASLISFLENEGVIKIEPENLVVKDFDHPVEQSVFFSQNDRRLVGGFPVLNVTVGPHGYEENARVVLPFTINKYLRGDSLGLEQVLRFLESVG